MNYNTSSNSNIWALKLFPPDAFHVKNDTKETGYWVLCFLHCKPYLVIRMNETINYLLPRFHTTRTITSLFVEVEEKKARKSYWNHRIPAQSPLTASMCIVRGWARNWLLCWWFIDALYGTLVFPLNVKLLHVNNLVEQVLTKSDLLGSLSRSKRRKDGKKMIGKKLWEPGIKWNCFGRCLFKINWNLKYLFHVLLRNDVMQTFVN